MMLSSECGSDAGDSGIDGDNDERSEYSFNDADVAIGEFGPGKQLAFSDCRNDQHFVV